MQWWPSCAASKPGTSGRASSAVLRPSRPPDLPCRDDSLDAEVPDYKPTGFAAKFQAIRQRQGRRVKKAVAKLWRRARGSGRDVMAIGDSGDSDDSGGSGGGEGHQRQVRFHPDVVTGKTSRAKLERMKRKRAQARAAGRSLGCVARRVVPDIPPRTACCRALAPHPLTPLSPRLFVCTQHSALRRPGGDDGDAAVKVRN